MAHFIVLMLCFPACAVKQTAETRPSSPIEGSTFTAKDEYGNTLDLKIEKIEPDPQDPDRELRLYSVLYHNLQDGNWENLCTPDRYGISKAIPLEGYWDESGKYIDDKTQITFACTVGVIAKCVRWGYKPWKTVNGISLRPFHLACTRMARADYCGSGQHHTRDGTAINIYDNLDIQKSEPEKGMKFEAAWDENGATYINHARWYETLSQLKAECPEKLAGRLAKGKPLSIEEIRKRWPSSKLFEDSFIRKQGK